jgi:hypothetical protein
MSPHDSAHRWQTSRRSLLQAGSLGFFGLSLTEVLRWQNTVHAAATPAPKSVIFLFLTGGASQHDTFDMKPNAPAEVRGEFSPIATRTPGTDICEHMPLLAQRSPLWSLVRSVTHSDNGHDSGTYLMLTGRSKIPATYKSMTPQAIDDPSIVAIAGAVTPKRGLLPTAAVVPEKLYHSNSGVFSGQFAGLLGKHNEPWMVECTDKPHGYHAYSGAFPNYLFNLHKGEPSDKRDWRYEVPNLTLPEGVFSDRFQNRQHLLSLIDEQRRSLDAHAAVGNYDRITQSAVSMMTDPKVRAALDVRKSDPETLKRYGNNSFGWSTLMARRLIEAGVNMVQVNLGNFGSWDLHGNNFSCLKNYLFPPTDLAVSALLDDLKESGLLDTTLVVMAGEFGRTPKITHIAPEIYKYAGRDHWGPCQTILLAGGGIKGGQVIGASDKIGAYPISDPQTPENFAATIYQGLSIPSDAVWHDVTGRPHFVYQSDPIPGLA